MNQVNIRRKKKRTKQVIQKLQNFIALFKEEKKKSLEEKMLSGLEILMHKRIHQRVEVDINQTGDDIDINLINSAGKVIDRGSLSMGERQRMPPLY